MVLASFGWFGGDWRALFDGGAFAFHGVSVIFVSIVLVPVFFVFFYSACFAEGVPESWLSVILVVLVGVCTTFASCSLYAHNKQVRQRRTRREKTFSQAST